MYDTSEVGIGCDGIENGQEEGSFNANRITFTGFLYFINPLVSPFSQYNYLLPARLYVPVVFS